MQSVESNRSDPGDFCKWSKPDSSEAMMAVDLGARGADDSRNCVEYLNSRNDKSIDP